MACMVGEARDATGIEVKAPIIIQMRAGDPANDPENRKIMAYDQNPFRVGMALHDLIQSVPCALGDIRQSFAARDADLGGFAAPAQ